MGIGSADAARLWAGRLARTPFAAVLAKGGPLIVAGGEKPQVVFATQATFSAFQAGDADSLQSLLFSSDSAGSRRLVQLAAELRADAPPRLERLRFFVARKPHTAPWLCARIRRDGESYFVAADLAAAPDTAPPPAVTPAAPLRFVWRLDAQGRFGAPDPTLADGLGAEAPREGETLDAFAARAGFGPEWPEAVAARETFSRLRVVWPEEGRAQARVALVSGAPAFAAGATFQGFRGFGLLTGERIALARPAEPEAPPKPAAPKPGDAAALLGLLQRQHSSAPANSPQGPALAIISALATLLQAKPTPPRRPEPPAPSPAPPASQGAEIVVLRPHAAPEPRENDSVALTSQERDAFKEIARQLGANVRDAPPAAEPAAPAANFAALADNLPADGPDEPEPRPEPKAPPARVAAPADSDFAALVDTLPLAALIVRGGETLYANKTLIDLAGYKSLADFCARDGLKAIFRGRDPAELAPGGVVTGAPFVCVSGRILTVDAQVKPIVWQGAPAELVAMRRSYEADHQEEMRALEHEMDFHAARARELAQALEAVSDGMARIDREGRILGLNKGAEQLFGHNQGEVAGESFAVLFALDSQSEVAGVLERLRQGEAKTEKLKALVRRADGTRLPVLLTLGRVAKEPDPEIFMLLSQARGEEAASAPAGEAGKGVAESELLSRVSHEMRTPLHAILGFAEVILEERMGPLGNERYRDYIKNIHDSGRHVLSLANDLLDLSRAELGKMELQFAPLDVNAIVRESVSLMQPQAARERVIVRLSLYDKLPNVMADERSLRQIMLNLMANAVKYNEPGGQVIVSTALDDQGSVILRVRDTGVGMNESELAVALEPFRRVPGARSGEGAGLGLPLTKALVEANHAGFSIKSRKDQGTLVEIAFPVRRAAQ